MSNRGERRVLKDILKQFGKRWFICVVFGFDLLILVALSEVIRNIFVGLSPNTFDLGNWVILFFLIFLVVPLFIIPLWYFSPFAIKKLLVTFGLSDESPIIEKTAPKKKEENIKKNYNIVYSKWLYYVLIAILLLVFIALTSYGTSLGIEIAARFLPTFVGLFITLIIFWIFFDVREYLEWKPVENKVKQKIGKQIHVLFAELSIFCQIQRVHYDSADERRKLIDKQLDELTTKEIEFTIEAKKDLLDEDVTRLCGEDLDSILNTLGRYEGRYAKFLDSKIEASLMNIQDYLDELSLKFRLRHSKDEDYFKSLQYLIRETMKEIKNLKTNGIWFDW